MSSAVGQSPWLQPKGNTYLQTGYYLIPEYNTLFARSGTPYELDTKITNQTFQFYGEYGLSNNNAVVLTLPFKSLSSTNNNATLMGLGNIEAGIKQKIIHSNMPVTAHVNISMPTGTYDKSSGLRSGYKAWDIAPMISTGKGWNNIYLQGFAGAHLRTNSYSTLTQAGIETGYKPVTGVWGIVYINWLHSLRDGDRNEIHTSPYTGLYVNDQEYLAWGMKWMAKLTDGYGIIAGFSGSFSGHRVAHSPLLHIGIYKD
jgi:hypothetical protein